MGSQSEKALIRDILRPAWEEHSPSPSITEEGAFLQADSGCLGRYHHPFKAVVKRVGFEVRLTWRQTARLKINPNLLTDYWLY